MINAMLLAKDDAETSEITIGEALDNLVRYMNEDYLNERDGMKPQDALEHEAAYDELVGMGIIVDGREG